MSEGTVTFITSDNEQLITDWDVYRCFGIFSPPDNPPNSLEPIPLPQVSSSVLTKVIEYCAHHGYDKLRPIEKSQDADDPRKRQVSEIGEWDQQFIQVDQEMLFELVLAANYLDIPSLLDVGCKTVANQIKGKTPEEVRKHFNIVSDFTPEEEAQIKKENEWDEDR
ncbi:unnamed protein product [Rhizoctonia solani]|uniref:E3 ubiquitin ligase complex SCF subunit n=1 Tax=Rhizoctonia solani TaxID=456999 RepID=A0A8H3H337_9AGAM|nr:unnamed protein product [Rhizoctonia solani]CAE6521468.1 unnamed protein product [Rhizoctonia solani]